MRIQRHPRTNINNKVYKRGKGFKCSCSYLVLPNLSLPNSYSTGRKPFSADIICYSPGQCKNYWNQYTIKIQILSTCCVRFQGNSNHSHHSSSMTCITLLWITFQLLLPCRVEFTLNTHTKDMCELLFLLNSLSPPGIRKSR